MFITDAYKAIKKRLTDAGINVPIFFYIGQYQPGRDNTSYKVPAIYLEFQKEIMIDFFPTKRMVAKAVNIKLHYISYAPFKNHDNEVQDNALDEHNAKLVEIDKLLNGWNAVEERSDRILTQQLIPKGGSFMFFINSAVGSIIDYQTEIFSNHMREVIPIP